MNGGFGMGGGGWNAGGSKSSYEAYNLSHGKTPGGSGSGGGGAGCATVVIGFAFFLAGIALTVIIG